MTVETMKQEDSAAIAKLEQRVFVDGWSEQSILDIWNMKHSVILVVRRVETVLGYLIGYYAADEMEIVRIAVVEDDRRSGIGRRLIWEFADFGKKKGIKNIFLEVRERNTAAIAFYRNYGFMDIGIRKNFYQKPMEHALLMKKELKEE